MWRKCVFCKEVKDVHVIKRFPKGAFVVFPACQACWNKKRLDYHKATKDNLLSGKSRSQMSASQGSSGLESSQDFLSMTVVEKKERTVELADRFKVLKADMLSVLIAEKAPVTAKKFERLFHQHFRKNVGFREFGFRSVDEVLQSLTGDVACFPEGGVTKYLFVKNDDEFLSLVRKMVRHQKDTYGFDEKPSSPTKIYLGFGSLSSVSAAMYPPYPYVVPYGAPPRWIVALQRSDPDLYNEFVAINGVPRSATYGMEVNRAAKIAVDALRECVTGKSAKSTKQRKNIHLSSANSSTSGPETKKRSLYYDRISLLELRAKSSILSEETRKNLKELQILYYDRISLLEFRAKSSILSEEMRKCLEEFQTTRHSGESDLSHDCSNGRPNVRTSPKLDTIAEASEMPIEQDLAKHKDQESLDVKERENILESVADIPLPGETGINRQSLERKEETTAPESVSHIPLPEEKTTTFGGFEPPACQTDVMDNCLDADSVENECLSFQRMQVSGDSINFAVGEPVHDVNDKKPLLDSGFWPHTQDSSQNEFFSESAIRNSLHHYAVRDNCDGLVSPSHESTTCADATAGEGKCFEDGILIPYDQTDAPFIPFSDWLMNYETALEAKIVVDKQDHAYFYYVCEVNPLLDIAYERLGDDMRKFYTTFKVADVQMKLERVRTGQFCVLCAVSDDAFEFIFKRGRILNVHQEGTVDVECLDDLTLANVEYSALLELDTRFTELPLRYAPVRFRALKPVVQDVFDDVEEVRFQCISALGNHSSGHNVLVVGFDVETQQFIIDVIVRRDLGYCSLLSVIAAFLCGVPYRAELEDEAWKHFEHFMRDVIASR